MELNQILHSTYLTNNYLIYFKLLARESLSFLSTTSEVQKLPGTSTPLNAKFSGVFVLLQYIIGYNIL